MFVEETAEQYVVDAITALQIPGVAKIGRTSHVQIIPDNVRDVAKILPFVGVGIYGEGWEQDKSAQGTVQTLAYDMAVFIVVTSRHAVTGARDAANAIHRQIKYALRGHVYTLADGTRAVIRYRGREYQASEEYPELLVVQQNYSIQYIDSNQ